jgi:hypothetical protein
VAARRKDTAPAQTVVLFGNPAPQMQIDGVGSDAAHLSQSVTRAEMWVGFDDPENVSASLSTGNDRMLSMIARGLDDAHSQYAIGINELEQIIAVHAGGAKPDWVSSSDPEFANALAAHFGCPVGEPVALLTNGGRDALHSQHLGTAAQPAAFNYIALTASVTAPSAADTTLTGEIATAGGGLIRAQATFAHTAGTNTSTLTKTFTANGSDVLPVTLAQIGVFNASSSGTLAYHTALGTTALLSVVGDSVTITETLTAG